MAIESASSVTTAASASLDIILLLADRNIKLKATEYVTKMSTSIHVHIEFVSGLISKRVLLRSGSDIASAQFDRRDACFNKITSRFFLRSVYYHITVSTLSSRKREMTCTDNEANHSSHELHSSPDMMLTIALPLRNLREFRAWWPQKARHQASFKHSETAGSPKPKEADEFCARTEER